MIVAVLGLLAACAAVPEKPIDKPQLAVMSALPLFWHEGDVGAALSEDQRAPVIRRLAEAYHVTPLDAVSANLLRPFKLMILAQPRALAPAELVALDEWVRGGGRLVIFADPLLNWPSQYPPGDRRRPPLTSLLDPLLGHWGLRLDRGMAGGDAPELVTLAGHAVAAHSAGRWRRLGGGCVIADESLRADCTLGKGRAALVADGDVLDLTLGESQNRDNGAAILTLLQEMAAESSAPKP